MCGVQFRAVFYVVITEGEASFDGRHSVTTSVAISANAALVILAVYDSLRSICYTVELRITSASHNEHI